MCVIRGRWVKALGILCAPGRTQTLLKLLSLEWNIHIWIMAFLRQPYPYVSDRDSANVDKHYNDVIMTTVASQITSLTVVYSTVYSEADQRKHQSSASLAFVRGIHRDRWIPRTKGQLRGKCFHLMTSSWDNNLVKEKSTGNGRTWFVCIEHGNKTLYFNAGKV